MKPTVLLFNFHDQKRLLKIKQALMPLGFRLKRVEPVDYCQQLGWLAGLDGFSKTGEIAENSEIADSEMAEVDSGKDSGKDSDKDDSETGEREKCDELSDEMLVMAGFTSRQVDQLILAFRKKGVGFVPYKAVLTPVNSTWDVRKLFDEIKKEHEAMRQTD